MGDRLEEFRVLIPEGEVLWLDDLARGIVVCSSSNARFHFSPWRTWQTGRIRPGKR